MIASPGDVPSERRIAESIVHEWNAIHSADRGQVLLPVRWETHASPALGERAQARINRQLLDDADVLVAMFWTRIGTPTGLAVSGTVEEIEKHRSAGKPAMIYFSSMPVVPDTLELDQIAEVRKFRDQCRQSGLIETYEDVSQFAEKFRRQLQQTIIEKYPREPGLGDAGDTIGSIEAERSRAVRAQDVELLANLSTDAQALLGEAAQDRHGIVMIVRTMGGTSIQTNRRNFTEPGNPRSEERWRAVARELITQELLSQRDQKGDVLAVTDEGFRVADLLASGSDRPERV